MIDFGSTKDYDEDFTLSIKKKTTQAPETDVSTPAGTQFGEKGERVRSARQRKSNAEVKFSTDPVIVNGQT